MFSMSDTRTHFCVVVALETERGACPRKMGLNWSMPAMVSSTVGSEGMREAPVGRQHDHNENPCTLDTLSAQQQPAKNSKFQVSC